jgi:indolepyruvate ferredoxin oxidoreductase beta subunit
VLASELMEAGRALQRGLVDANKTTFIASSHRVYSMTERTAMGDGRVDEAKLLAGAQAAARQFIGADFQQLAEQAGSLIAPALYGALAASARLPFSRAQFEATIERSGVGVQTSLKAFAAGFDAAMQVLKPQAQPLADATPMALPLHQRVGPKLQALAQSLEGTLASSAHEVIASGLTRLTDYQDLRYAMLYARRLQDMAQALNLARLAPSLSHEILREGARHLALWMSYEDTVRVADLKTRRSRFQRVSQEVNLDSSQLIDIHEFMHPRLEEIADTLPAAWGRWLLGSRTARAVLGRFTQKGRVVQTSSLRGFVLLYCVASLRRIRPVSLRYETEQLRIQAWWTQAIALLPQHADLALEVLRTQQLVKGYGDTHARGWRHFEQLMATLLRLQQLPDAANRLRALRKAALSDDSGRSLEQALMQLVPA